VGTCTVNSFMFLLEIVLMRAPIVSMRMHLLMDFLWMLYRALSVMARVRSCVQSNMFVFFTLSAKSNVSTSKMGQLFCDSHSHLSPLQ